MNQMKKNNNSVMLSARIKENYNRACEAYLEDFCEKHGYDYEDNMWVGNHVGWIAEIADLYIGLDDIRTDIDNNVPEDEFIKWYDYSLRLGMLNAHYPNYESWLKNCPIKSEEEILAMEDLRNKIENLKSDLEILCKKWLCLKK